MNETLDNSISQKKNKKIILLLVLYIILGAVVWKIVLAWSKKPATQQDQMQKGIAMIVQSVQKIMLLPSEETPQISTIQDIQTLKKTQNFFVDADNGDKILVYPVARKVIIYREKTNQIINAALNINTGGDKSLVNNQ